MNLRATKKVARQVAHQLQQHNGGVVYLHGVMGAGKTTLVGEVVRILCPTAQPNSPTYTLINQYAENIYHADLYRLWHDDNLDVQPDENQIQQILDGTGILDLCVPGNYVFVEWSHGIKLGDVYQMTINIKVKEDGNREFIID